MNHAGTLLTRRLMRRFRRCRCYADFGAPVAGAPRQPTVSYRVRFQPIDATVWWNRSAGVSKFSVFLGRSFNCLATALSCA